MNTQTIETKQVNAVEILRCKSCNEDTKHDFNGRYNPSGKPIYVCDSCGTERAA